MATLFERLVGDLPENSSSQKIPIHPFISVLYEMERGNITGAQASAIFNLDAAQQADGAALMGFITSATQKSDMLRVLKDWLYIAEWGKENSDIRTRYWSQANLVARLNQEKARQGV